MVAAYLRNFLNEFLWYVFRVELGTELELERVLFTHILAQNLCTSGEKKGGLRWISPRLQNGTSITHLGYMENKPQKNCILSLMHDAFCMFSQVLI